MLAMIVELTTPPAHDGLDGARGAGGAMDEVDEGEAFARPSLGSS